MSQTALQVALAEYLDASIPIIMTRFDFSGAVKKMIALEYGWVGGMIWPELKTHLEQHNMSAAWFNCSPELEARLDVNARTIARDSLILVRNHAVREIITPDWSGYSFWSGGFSARVTPDGVMSLELQLQWTATAGRPELTELRKRFEYLRAQSYAAASAAAAVPVDFVSTKRRFLPLNDHE